MLAGWRTETHTHTNLLLCICKGLVWIKLPEIWVDIFVCSWCPALHRALCQPDPASQSPCACTAGAAAFCTSSDVAAFFSALSSSLQHAGTQNVQSWGQSNGQSVIRNNCRSANMHKTEAANVYVRQKHFSLTCWQFILYCLLSSRKRGEIMAVPLSHGAEGCCTWRFSEQR